MEQASSWLEGNQLTNSPDTPRQPPINSILGPNQKFYTSLSLSLSLLLSQKEFEVNSN